MNGQEAIDLYLADRDRAAIDNHNPFDTILMDNEMPVMCGPESTRQLRQLGCKALIVGTTGNVLVDDVRHFKSMGTEAVLAKPLTKHGRSSIGSGCETTIIDCYVNTHWSKARQQENVIFVF